MDVSDLRPWSPGPTYLPAPPPLFYNSHSKELKSAQRFSPTPFIQTPLEFNCCRRTSYPGSLDKTLYTDPFTGKSRRHHLVLNKGGIVVRSPAGRLAISLLRGRP